MYIRKKQVLCDSIAASPLLPTDFSLASPEASEERMVFNVNFEICIFCSFLVAIDVITSREVQCHLHVNPQDPTLNSSDDFIARVVKR